MSVLLPAGMDATVALVLVALSVLTSAITASTGAGGGLLMLGAMATVVPPLALIPAHGLVQIGSNAGRAWMLRRHVRRDITMLLLTGAALGTLAGAMVLVRLPTAWLQIAVAAFILWTVWVPASPNPRPATVGIGSFGVLSGFLTLFVGATGPLVAAYTRRLLPDRHAAMTTMAACMTGLHLFKLLAFGYAGFDWMGWAALCAAMIAAGLIGTRLGVALLGRITEAQFQPLFRTVLSLLALHAGWRGLKLLLA